MKNGISTDALISAIMVLLVSYVQPYIAAAVGGFAAYIYLHKHGKVELNMREFFFIVCLAMFTGYFTKEIMLHFKFEEDFVNPVIALAGFTSPKILDAIYALDFTKLLKRILDGK